MEDVQSSSNSKAPAVINSGEPQLPESCEPPSEQNPVEEAVWVIFGAGGYTGEELARTALKHGDNVTAVGWSGETTAMQFSQEWKEGNSLGLVCDVRVRATVEAVLQKSIQRWGHIDIIANCTGYGVVAACEDQDEHEIRTQFETNFMGTLNIIQLSLPHFRDRLFGRYLLFSSTAGALGAPGLGPYCAAKYAIEGLVESMAYEVDCFGIKATLIEPGYARLRDPASTSETAVTSASVPAADEIPTTTTAPKESSNVQRGGGFHIKSRCSAPYAGDHAPARHFLRTAHWLGEDPEARRQKLQRNAELAWQLAHCAAPPLRLVLGAYAVESVRDRLRSLIEETEDWKFLNFPAAAEESPSQAQDVEMT